MKRAFTLIELMVTIAIIGVLTGLASLSYTGIKARSRDAQRKNDLSQIKLALSTYYSAQIPAQYVIAASKITLNDTNDTLTAALKPAYIRDIPLDPLNTNSNVYKYQSLNTGKNFNLFGTLENKNDTKGWAGGSTWVADGYILQDE